jgi:photosystem II stability/assembly factor-like uncharacterized protein
MRLCVGTAKGIVILDPERGATPVMVSADPPSVWCMAQDCADSNLLYAGSIHNAQAGSARGKSSLSASDDGGRTWRDITLPNARDEEVWALAASPARPGEVLVGTSHARIFRSEERGSIFRECAAFLKLPGRERWTFPQPPHIPHVRSITFDTRNSDIVYVGVEEGGAFRSRDRGVTFEPLNQNIYADIHCVVADPEDSMMLYATTGAGIYTSATGGASWTQVKGMARSYAVPLLARAGAGAPVYTAAASGPPPTWTMDQIGADALLFYSTDRGNSFAAIPAADGIAHPTRGMVMRLVPDPGDEHVLFGALSDGGVVKIDEREETISMVAEKLPPVYDLAVIH